MVSVLLVRGLVQLSSGPPSTAHGSRRNGTVALVVVVVIVMVITALVWSGETTRLPSGIPEAGFATTGIRLGPPTTAHPAVSALAAEIAASKKLAPFSPHDDPVLDFVHAPAGAKVDRDCWIVNMTPPHGYPPPDSGPPPEAGPGGPSVSSPPQQESHWWIVAIVDAQTGLVIATPVGPADGTFSFS